MYDNIWNCFDTSDMCPSSHPVVTPFCLSDQAEGIFQLGIV